MQVIKTDKGIIKYFNFTNANNSLKHRQAVVRTVLNHIFKYFQNDLLEEREVILLYNIPKLIKQVVELGDGTIKVLSLDKDVFEPLNNKNQFEGVVDWKKGKSFIGTIYLEEFDKYICDNVSILDLFNDELFDIIVVYNGDDKVSMFVQGYYKDWIDFFNYCSDKNEICKELSKQILTLFKANQPALYNNIINEFLSVKEEEQCVSLIKFVSDVEDAKKEDNTLFQRLDK